ncbi:MAG TPA: DCC1-like thiol-disulfide oxidoreductase family protein [Tepidisphaeraceae bacterium]|jgi:predicted DCC family thiol-disulfide oxidoreductase YuxK|nr:DCC1-like thiol-disulfide oxidoreductase family protein [Tepidisphaeraceae bacterium]
MPLRHTHAIILFDGVCSLCNASVNFVIDRDPAGYFHFASQQSAAGQALLRQYGLPTDAVQSIVLIENGRCSTRSLAALQVARRLAGWAKWCWLGIVIPAFLRDGIYDFIAANRYRWFGQLPACRIPTPELKERFLD